MNDYDQRDDEIVKVSVLMPTYNDEKYIAKAIESVLNQQEIEVELIIIDDGSTDKTQDIVLSYKNRRIKYIKQENKGQLDALLKGSKCITGDFVCLFHSDDMIADNFAFKRNAIFILENNLDGVYSDYIKIDSNDTTVGVIKVVKNFGEKTLEKLFKMYGSNPIGDPFFVKKQAFFEKVIRDYVVWNEPYWFTIRGRRIELLRLGYINHPWYKYRVYSGNYVRSDIGKFVVSNGVIRTVIDLSKFYRLCFVNFRFVHRLPTKLVVRRVGTEYHHEDIGRLIARILKNYDINSEKNIYYKAVLNFYTLKSDVTLDLDDKVIEQAPVLVGKDVNVFYKMILNENLPELYQLLLNMALKGEFAIKIDGRYKMKMKSILKFLNFEAPIFLREVER